MSPSDINGLVQMVTTTLEGYGASLAEIKQNQADLKKELVELRIDIVKLEGRAYDEKLAALEDKLKAQQEEIAALRKLADRAEGLTTGAKLAWGALLSSPGLLALLVQIVGG